MSWSASVKEKVTAAEVTPDAFNFTPQQGNGADESVVAFEAAVAAVKEILDAGVVGPADKKFTISFSGHANTGNVPVSGWVKDFISISIYQATEESNV